MFFLTVKPQFLQILRQLLQCPEQFFLSFDICLHAQAELRLRHSTDDNAGRQLLNGIGFGLLPGIALWKSFTQAAGLEAGTEIPPGIPQIPGNPENPLPPLPPQRPVSGSTQTRLLPRARMRSTTRSSPPRHWLRRWSSC